MKKADIFEIALRILGLYLFATSVLESISAFIISFEFVAQSKQSGAEDGINWTLYTVIIFANLFLFAVVAYLLFFKANFIVRKICSASDFEEDVKLFAEPVVIYEMVILITGLILIAWTLPDFFVKLRTFIIAKKEGGWHSNFETSFFWTSVVKIIVGSCAIIFAKLLARFFAKQKT